MLVKEMQPCALLRSGWGPRASLGEEVSEGVVLAADLLQPDRTGDPGARVAPHSWSHLEVRAGGGLLHTLVSWSLARGFLREGWGRCVMLCFSLSAKGPSAEERALALLVTGDGCRAEKGDLGKTP